ncbi:MAG: ribonuclease III [Candidatus Marinimicrobia bacterium]|nr:ribonuclease III [Candidatus Neomarinimicrobiota bacterium]
MVNILNRIKTIYFSFFPNKPHRLAKKVYNVYSYSFDDEDLLRQAFTHTSAIDYQIQTKVDSYERLEFLGDAVIEMIVTRFLFEQFSEAAEGELTQMRAKLVNRTTLASVSRGLHFGQFLLLGKSGENDNLRNSSSILCDIYESFLGALYLDGGYKAAYNFTYQTLLSKHKRLLPAAEIQNYKGKLLEYCQQHNLDMPKFVTTHEEGPAHGKYFEISVLIGKEWLGTGTGTTKKAASQRAARQALSTLLDSEE